MSSESPANAASGALAAPAAWRFWPARFGLGGFARAIRHLAREHGVPLHWSWRGVSFPVAGRELTLRRRDFWLLCHLLSRPAGLQRRLGPVPATGEEPIGIGVPARYRQFDTGELLWHPSVPELVDTMAGYCQRGGPREGGVAFDVGAYVGEATIPLARRVGPRGRVFAFEPEPHCRALLERNVREAGLRNVVVLPQALWKESTQLALHTDGGPGSALQSDRAAPCAGAVSVKTATLTLADACERTGVVPDFVKLDVEGAELEIVERGLPVIVRGKISWAIASYHVREGAPTAARLEALFRSVGHRAETGYPEHLTTWAWPP